MCEVISLEYKYLAGVPAPEMGTANHSKALSTFQILHNPQIPRHAVLSRQLLGAGISPTIVSLIFIKNLLDLLHKSDLFKP